jgi:hypothetical protein
MTNAELTKETEALADEIGRGMAMMLWDKYRITLPPAAEKDLGTLAVMNCLPIHGLVEKARTVSA